MVVLGDCWLLVVLGGCPGCWCVCHVLGVFVFVGGLLVVFGVFGGLGWLVCLVCFGCFVKHKV